MKKPFVIYPFLFAVFPTLALYAHNIGELSLSSVWAPLAISFGFTLLLFTLSWLLFRSPIKAGVITLVFVIIFFADGYVQGLFDGGKWVRPAKYLPIAWGIFFMAMGYLTYRTKMNLNNLTHILNVVGITLVVVSSLNITINEFRRPNYVQHTNIVVQRGQVERGALPDIYYIILDAYASASTLKELYNLDNSELMNYLSKKGFYIADRSTSNYGFTELSLPSSLNMVYLNDHVSKLVGEQSKDMTIPIKMIKNNAVVNFLKFYGYRYVHFSGSFKNTSYDEYADQNIDCSKKSGLLAFIIQDQFVSLLIEKTLMKRIIKSSDETTTYREYVLNAFDKLAKMPESPGPKFVFAHIVCPHWPYVFGANGEEIKVVSWMVDPVESQTLKYINQVKFLTGKIKTLADEILSKSKIPPIIILQGDHGFREAYCLEPTSGKSPSDKCLKDTFGILNVYYLPNGGNKLLYNSISPVNSFRLIFNFYFGADYELLRDQCFFSNYFDSPYKFINATHIRSEIGAFHSSIHRLAQRPITPAKKSSAFQTERPSP